MDVITPSPTDLFGAFLVDEGLINHDDLARAQSALAGSDTPLHIVIERLGLAKEDVLLEMLAEFLGLPLLQRSDFTNAPAADETFEPAFLKKRGIFPMELRGNTLLIAFSDPTNTDLIGSLVFHLERPIECALASARDIEWAVNAYYGEDTAPGAKTISPDDDVEALKNLATEQPVIRFVNRLIEDAIERRASDIHLEPEERGLQVRFRVDGVLNEGQAPAPSMAAAITSRIKIMAKLNIAERRLPQDGRIRTIVRGGEIDLRVSTTPTLHGESVVLRVLDKSAVTLEFAALGFSDEALERFQGLLKHPHGIILVTGPTGSGKTTTLYTSLKSLNDGRRKIFSVEDPVEYQLAGVNQIAVQPQIGLDFARALRSILRQDPDIIMIGEIRDLETAEIAIQASLTGHLVLATLHTNTAAATITRLLDMGVEDYLLASTVVGVAAQRLVRTLCLECAVLDEGVVDLIARLEPEALVRNSNPTTKKAAGCKACQHTGFRGRTSIIEVASLNQDIRKLIMNSAGDAAIEEAAKSEGMQTMLQEGIDKVLTGVTALEEVLRVAKMN
jgi:general secretion pathway protein E